MRQNILYHLQQDVQARGRDTVAKLHRVIDLIGGQSILNLKQIECGSSPFDFVGIFRKQFRPVFYNMV